MDERVCEYNRKGKSMTKKYQCSNYIVNVSNS